MDIREKIIDLNNIIMELQNSLLSKTVSEELSAMALAGISIMLSAYFQEIQHRDIPGDILLELIKISTKIAQMSKKMEDVA